MFLLVNNLWFSPSYRLAGLSRGARGCVARGHWVVDVDHDARISRLVRARERDEVLRAVSTAAAGNGNLGAGDVELGTASTACGVETDVLGTQQVVAVLQTAGDGDGNGAGVCVMSVKAVLGELDERHTLCGPGHAPPELGHVLVDLGPNPPLAIPSCGRLALRNLSDVKGHGAWVGDGGLGIVGKG